MWYHRAAKKGHVEAQYAIGRAFEIGDGVKKNRRNALLWYRKAASSGHRKARKIVNSGVLTKEQEKGSPKSPPTARTTTSTTPKGT
jgi:TPR repeat protein